MSRSSSIQISKNDFRTMGHQLVDVISELLETLPTRPVTQGETPKQLQHLLKAESMPDQGTDSKKLLHQTTELLFNHSLFNGHPKFLGYITSSPAPLGMLADFLATAINANCGAQILSPIATEIEKQTIHWLAQFIGVSPTYGGILVSGGNMANFTAFLAARTAMASETFKKEGFQSSERLTIYCSKTTHTWIEKAAVLFGHGYNSIRWIDADSSNKMDNALLEQTIQSDIEQGYKPFIVIGTAGDVSTGAVDDLKGIATICKTYNTWFHIDGAYGIPAAILPELRILFEGLEQADSIAMDPHKWLYSPLEAGCTLVKNPQHLINTYSSHPEYYNFSAGGDATQNFYEYGFQNSRGFRALKVWLTLQQLGRQGYINLIREDIHLAELFFKKANDHPELEAVMQNLSITTLRYIPNGSHDENYLNTLNETLLNGLQRGGEVFLSNAIVQGKYCLRGCIVNFRTTEKDIEEIIEIIVQEGKKIHQSLQNK